MFICKECKYETKNESIFKRHLKSKKHLKNTANTDELNESSNTSIKKEELSIKKEELSIKKKELPIKKKELPIKKKELPIKKKELSMDELISENESLKSSLENKDKLLEIIQGELTFNKTLVQNSSIIINMLFKFIGTHVDPNELERIRTAADDDDDIQENEENKEEDKKNF